MKTNKYLATETANAQFLSKPYIMGEVSIQLGSNQTLLQLSSIVRIRLGSCYLQFNLLLHNNAF